MVCHPHVLPQSSTSSFLIRPINLQPTANQASHLISSHLQTHHTHKPKPRSPSSDHRFAPSNLYNPETAPHLPWVSSSPWPQITHHAHHTHKHRTELELLIPQNLYNPDRRPICRGSHPAHGPSTTSVPKGLLLLPFSSFFSSIRIRVKGF